MEDLKNKNDKLVDEVLHLVDIIEEKDKQIEYLENKLNKIIKKKSLIFNFYQKELSLINNIHFMQPVNGNRPVHWFSNIFTNKKKELQKFLKKNNIET